ncbi:hypothetical protein D0Z07_6549 [Hyphodiscus hymeniophilus]|uniref:Arylsulfotransferase n=1 Tax=Hyphodiscus hymeniophilus TaxID=353542 RepID=A0A9P7AVI3_9HELO|nr:hypothetical protein D0Z07_6549 [Hyphodiscus hymeniophilus]
MRSFYLLAALHVPWVATFSFNGYDLGFHGTFPRQHFHSVDFEPPKTKITKWNDQCDNGYLFLTPRGPLVTDAARGPVISDPKGNLVWMNNDKFAQALNFNVQSYKGKDYLTFWTKVGEGLKGDSHEFRITPQGTALITIYNKHEADCTELGLGKSCWIQDGLFQEIDIETGNLIFEWRATDHISMNDVFSSPSMKDGHGKSKEDAFDFFHINSVDKTEEGDYIISARYMHAVVCISGKTGDILWQLGGKNNEFNDLNHALDFAWQHHVTWHGNNTLTLFDNHANNVFHMPSSHSKGMLIHLDMDSKTARLIQKFVHPDKILNVSQGSVQLVPESGNVLVGFGNSPTYIEYAPNGHVLCAAHFAPHLLFEIIDFGFVKSYRVFKHPWVGRPDTVPDVMVKKDKVYVSWNGATEVKGWRLESAEISEASDDDFVTIQSRGREGFETAFDLPKHKHDRYVRIVALDASENIMAQSAVVLASPPSSSFWPTFFTLLFTLSLLTLLVFIVVSVSRQRGSRWLERLPLPRLPHSPQLHSLKTRIYTTIKRGARGSLRDWEADPLLLNEREA